MWLWFFTCLWACISLLVALFVIVDARNAYDGDPETHTLSGYIKRWRRQAAWRSWLLGALIASLALVPVYLFFHLVLEAI